MDRAVALKRRFWLKLAAGLLFAIVAYGGAYSVLVKRAQDLKYPALYFYCGRTDSDRWYPPLYGFESSFTRARRCGYTQHLGTVFAPAHWVDRKLRPETWGRPTAVWDFTSHSEWSSIPDESPAQDDANVPDD